MTMEIFTSREMGHEMRNQISSIDRDVLQYQLVGVANEMSEALRRTSYSSIIWDVYDYACALFSPNAEMLAQADTIPAQLGTMSTALRAMLKKHPLSKWRPGDVFICNDPYKGCTHTPDITVFSPVFNGGEIIAITSSIAHHVDIGGRVPQTTHIENTEVFGEGLIFPQMRIVKEGEYNEDVLDFISSNVRNPHACIGDLRAQIASCRTGEKRLEELAKRLGNGVFKELVSGILDYGEHYIRQVLSEIPGGVYEAEILNEDGVTSAELIKIKVKIEIKDREISLDFDGTSEQRPCALNCPWSSTVSMATYALKCLFAPSMPSNEGFNRPIKISAPLGSIVNPRRPAAVGGRHSLQQAVADVVIKALSPVAAERGAASAQISFPVFRATGIDTRNSLPGEDEKRFMIMCIMGGGMGGSVKADGLDAVDTHGGNCALLSAEVMETLSPIRVLQSRLVPGSGGEGKHRGGLAIERDFEVLSHEALVASSLQQGSDETAPWGILGGKSGKPAGMLLNPETPVEKKLPSRFRHTLLKKGDVVRVRSAGGGGFGDPAERSAEDIARDQAQGYI